MTPVSNEHQLLHTDDYKERFDTKAYLAGLYSGVDGHPNEAPFTAYFIENTIRMLKNNQKRLGNTKALDFGGGPSVWPSFILAQYVDSIRFCDYSPYNLDAVKNWVEKNDNAFDWTNFLKSVLVLAETPKEKLPEWEARARDALTRGGLSRCDVNDLNCPILSGKENEFDIIFSSLCLEAACLTIELYNETIKRLVRLLKPGGLILLLLARNDTFYSVGKEKFFSLPINEEKLRLAFEKTNELVDIHIDSSDALTFERERNTASDLDGKIVAYAFKKTQ